ncbi:MAG TPA: glycosyltransferase family 1 protein [Bryobacterales bacterium]|nr:glycosyltransferase family 1 protein [Bryobacterales bacterium]
MRFSVDAHAIGRKLTGNEVYIRSLLHGFANLDSGAEFVTYLSQRDVNGWVPSRFEKRYVAANRYWRLGYHLAGCLRRDRPDLIHVQYNAPLFCPVPVVVTVHDISFIEHPEYFPAGRAWQLRLSTSNTLRRASRILTISEFSRQRIARGFGIDPDDITVTPLAAQDHFRPLDRAAAAHRIGERYGIRRPYILTVGDLQPRKNQISLIRAFRELLQVEPQLPHLLVLAGKDTWFAPRVREEVQRSGLDGRVVLPGFVAEEDLAPLYNAADLFVFPSLYEGFGLPAIEAMACGRPVVCSSSGSLPEVVDRAAILIDPHSIGDLVRAMRDVLRDDQLRSRMGRQSLQRAAGFSWRETARRTLDVYYAVAEGRRQSVAPAPEPIRVAR